ncbi:hypothetical protein FB451DRAFT_1207578 [Mycena latifolia]|nr:hypothetical protein FB451DRAFT_1207578 [Mycena latifolia]
MELRENDRCRDRLSANPAASLFTPTMSLEAALHIVLAANPVLGLSPAFTLFNFIVSSVQAVQESKKQLEVLAVAVGQLLAIGLGVQVIKADCCQLRRTARRAEDGSM